MRLVIRNIVGVLSILLATIGAVAAQSDFPSRPIHLVVAWPPGSSIDIVARQLSDGLRDELGQSVIVDNKSGAAGIIGSEFVANSAPDGYTLLFNSAAMNMIAAMGTRTSYRMPDSFTPVANVYWAPMVLVSDPKLNIKTPQDLIELAKSKHGQLFYATAGHGAPSHFVAELFRTRTGIEATSVPFKGSPAAMLAQEQGLVAYSFSVSSTALPQVRNGKVKALAVTSKERLSVAPDIPTMEELGFKNFNASYWNGILGPKGMPPPIADRIAAAVNRVLARPEILERLVPTANVIDGKSNPQRFAVMMKDDLENWTQVAKAADIKPD